eukprot:2390690-Amphidinium_carterae.1
MAPEARAGHYSERSDVFSFGHVMFRTFCPDKDSEDVLLHTLCPDRQYEDVRTEAVVAGCLAREWPRMDRWVENQHCSDAARCIGKS